MNPETLALIRKAIQDEGATASVRTTSSGSSSSSGKAIDAYAIQAKSNDGTYTYYFRENADANHALMRKHNTTGVWSYAVGTGSYTTVYVNSTSAPSGSPSWATYGATF